MLGMVISQASILRFPMVDLKKGSLNRPATSTPPTAPSLLRGGPAAQAETPGSAHGMHAGKSGEGRPLALNMGSALMLADRREPGPGQSGQLAPSSQQSTARSQASSRHGLIRMQLPSKQFPTGPP